MRPARVNLFEQVGVPMVGFVENMAGYACPVHCGKYRIRSVRVALRLPRARWASRSSVAFPFP